jgi:hypothetical protein
MKPYLVALAASIAVVATPASAITFVNNLQVANGVDLSGLPTGVNGDRFGGFGSDLIYDAASDTYYGATDRGPGGGFLDYAPRIQQFKVATDPLTGAISNFQLVSTIVFHEADGVTPFNGKNSALLYGNAGNLGSTLDSEGLVRLSNGNFLVADEYGPSLYEFSPSGTFLRAFTPPANLVPKTAANNPDYTNGRPTITTGRQDNRGFEGLTVSNDGTKAYAILQDPLVNEGSSNDGRRSRNVRIVEYDIATGTSTAQYVYELESIADINARLASDPFTATNQGRSIGASAIIMLPNGQLLVLERDNRGLGVETDPDLPVGSKQLFKIDLTGADNVAGISLAGSNALPAGIDPVSKSLFLDIQDALENAGIIVTEKIEGVSFGKWLADGSLSMLVITDNDFSVTQNTTAPYEQFDVCTNGDGTVRETIALDGVCSAGLALVPTNIYAFKLSGAEALALGFSAPVPEPATWAMLIGGFAMVGAAMRRRAATVRFA